MLFIINGLIATRSLNIGNLKKIDRSRGKINKLIFNLVPVAEWPDWSKARATLTPFKELGPYAVYRLT